jgi:hypothetical protein
MERLASTGCHSKMCSLRSICSSPTICVFCDACGCLCVLNQAAPHQNQRDRSLHPVTRRMTIWFTLLFQLLLSFFYVSPANGFSIGTITGFDERSVSHRPQRPAGTEAKRTVIPSQQSVIRLCASLMDSSEPPTVKRREQFTSRSVAAASILDDVQSQSMFPLQRLESNPLYLKLDQRDRSFARLLVTTAERRMGQIDKVLQLCQREESKKVSWMGCLFSQRGQHKMTQHNLYHV